MSSPPLSITLSLLLALAGSVWAAPVSFSSPDGAVRHALRHNPDLVALRESVVEAQARAQQAGRLENPALDLESAAGRQFEGRIEIGIDQPVPVTDRLHLEKARASFQIAVARLQVAEEERQLAYQVRLAFLNLQQAANRQQLLQRRADIAQEWAQALEQSAAEGVVSPLTFTEQELTRAELQLEQEAIAAEITAAQSDLARLLGLPPGSRIAFSESLQPDTLPAPRPVGFRPQLVLAELAVEAAQLDIALASASRWEDLVIGLFWEGARIPGEPNDETESLVGLRVSVPLPFWRNAEPEVAERRASANRARLELKAVQSTIQHETAGAYAVMELRRTAAENVTSRLLPAARKQLRVVEAAYDRGEVDWISVFETRERLAALEASQLERRIRYHEAKLEWLHALGALVPSPFIPKLPTP